MAQAEQKARATKPRGTTRFTPQQIEAAKVDYVDRGLSYREVAAAHGISESYLRKLGAKTWGVERTEKNAARLLAEREAVLRARSSPKMDSKEALERYQTLSRAISKRIGQALASGPLAADMLAKLAGALRRCQEIEFAALGISASTSTHEHVAGPALLQDLLNGTRAERGLPPIEAPRP